jgi:hypothetical protein
MSLEGVKQRVLNTSSTSKFMKLSFNVSLTHLERIKGGIYCYDLTMTLQLKIDYARLVYASLEKIP